MNTEMLFQAVKLLFLKKIKMKFSAPVLTLFLILLVIPAPAQNTGQVKKDIVKAFHSGQSSDMKPYFQSFVSVNIPGCTGLYNAVRSQSQLQQFFDKYPVSRFSIEEDGFTGKKYFLIGCFYSGKRSWNVYFLMVPKRKNYCIQQMEIKKKN